MCSILSFLLPGDARNDSPGFSAKYCTYTVLDEADDSILSMGFKDKRECGVKSPNMETAAFVEALDELKDKVNILEVCTDSSSSITKIMSKLNINNVIHLDTIDQ